MRKKTFLRRRKKIIGTIETTKNAIEKIIKLPFLLYIRKIDSNAINLNAKANRELDDLICKFKYKFR